MKILEGFTQPALQKANVKKFLFLTKTAIWDLNAAMWSVDQVQFVLKRYNNFF